MAEELISWWNSPRNLFGSSPCSLASNDIGSLGWPIETRSVRSSDESDGSSSLLIQDVHHHHQPHPMPKLDAWNQPSLGRSEDNYSNLLLDSGMNYRPQMNSNNLSEEDSSMKQSLESHSDASSLLHTLFDSDSQPNPSLLDHHTSPYQMNSNDFLPKPSPTDISLWINASALSNVRLPSSHFLTNQNPHNHSIAAKHHEQGAALVNKRPRIETPSPLPTFKVRKEKLGDRITALQQLVSPFGKTDTASVLHEAIDYIKFLHDQVNSLSTPYLKYGSPPVQAGEKSKNEEGVTKDLKSRGLCLVPISSTFPVAAETSSDFWTPTFAGSFR